MRPTASMIMSRAALLPEQRPSPAKLIFFKFKAFIMMLL